MKKMSSLLSLCMHFQCLFLLAISFSMTTTLAFRYQEDTLSDVSCAEKLYDCDTKNDVWYECPITCSGRYFLEGSMSQVSDDGGVDPEQFFEFEVVKSDGKVLELADFEGYITVYAVIPLMPGMAQFHYEMLEHVQNVYPYTVQTLIDLKPHPKRNATAGDAALQQLKERQQRSSSSSSSSFSNSGGKSKTILLQSSEETSSVLQYLLDMPIVAGNPRNKLYTDRPMIFMITSDGKWSERLIAPTMTLFERRLAVFLQQLDQGKEL